MPITMGRVPRQDNDPDGARASFEAALPGYDPATTGPHQ
jgi:hypothetical protein